MLRIRRSVQATYNTQVNFMASQMLKVSGSATGTGEPGATPHPPVPRGDTVPDSGRWVLPQPRPRLDVLGPGASGSNSASPV